VFIRVPKTGSTSCVFYFVDSGILGSNDNYAYQSIDKINSKVKNTDSETELKFSSEDIEFTKYAHTKYKNLTIDFPQISDYECIAGIRNPVNRIISAALMLSNTKSVSKEELNTTIQFLLETKTVLSTPQHEYFREDSTLWPTENLDACIAKFITNKNGSIRTNWRCRSNGSEGYISMISPENIKQIYKMYSNDFGLWENAMKANSEFKSHNQETV